MVNIMQAWGHWRGITYPTCTKDTSLMMISIVALHIYHEYNMYKIQKEGIHLKAI